MKTTTLFLIAVLIGLSNFGQTATRTTATLVEEIGSETKEIKLYPNPASEGFVFIQSSVPGAIEVAVFDVLGKQVINTVVNNDRLDISGLRSGVYIVKITQSGTSVTKKLVVR